GCLQLAPHEARGAISAEIRGLLHPDRAARPPICARRLRELGTPQSAAGSNDLGGAEGSAAPGLRATSEQRSGRYWSLPAEQFREKPGASGTRRERLSTPPLRLRTPTPSGSRE